ncbi:MAG: FMN-binding protein, partial [Coriobacteriaceae bacterium]|nr:FMN-binding protein [Coriobacteriaceae bacterium]
GEYAAEGKGIGGKVPVTVTVKGGKIAEVTVGDNSETQGIGSKAIEQLPAAIVEAGGTEGVDAVSGASVTSKAIFSAVDECLTLAQGGTAEAGLWYNDGTYTAEGKGIGGKVPVTVEVKDGKIAEVTVGENSETQGIGSQAIEQLPSAIVAANGTEGVDAVSGASVTSKAIFMAVEDCLEQAGTTDVAPAGPTADKLADEAGVLADGTYTASARCSGGIVPVLVTYEDGKAVRIEIENDSALEEDDFKAVLAAIIGCRSQAVKAAVEIDRTAVENAVAAAEFSVDAAIEAASAAGAAAPAAESGTLTDGTLTDGAYTASGKGFDGEVPVTVTIEGGKIASVTVGYNYATSGIGLMAINQLPAKIVAANGTEGVDAVSGATVTSKAIFTAVNSCLKQAAS